MYKSFDPTLYEANDPETRQLVREFWLKHTGQLLYDNPDQFGVDLMTIDGSMYLEVERKRVWAGRRFPYPTVHVLQRKVKPQWIKPNVWFFVVNGPATAFLIFNSTLILYHMANVSIVQTIYCPDEPFYDIPLDKVQIGDFC